MGHSSCRPHPVATALCESGKQYNHCNDGRSSFNADLGVSEPNDTIASAVQTEQGSSHNPFSYTLANAAIGDNPSLAVRSTDVDYYQVKMDIGDVLSVQTGLPATTRQQLACNLSMPTAESLTSIPIALPLLL